MGTYIPDTQDALVALFDAATDSSVVVYNGPPPDTIYHNYVAVGYATYGNLGAGSPSVTGGQSVSPMGNNMRSEEFDVYCQLRVTSGNLDVPARRQEAKVVFDACNDALIADGTIGGTLPQSAAWPHVSRMFWQSDLNQAGSAGSYCTVDFTVRISIELI